MCIHYPIWPNDKIICQGLARGEKKSFPLSNSVSKDKHLFMILFSQWTTVSICKLLNALYLLQAMNTLCSIRLPNEKLATPQFESRGPGKHSLLVCNRKSNRSFQSIQTHAELPYWFICLCFFRM